MNMETVLSRILADNDQDMAKAEEWIRESDPSAVLNLWQLMNREWPNPKTEIMTRFAILGFATVIENMVRKELPQQPHDAAGGRDE